jgi:hypothetical protein
MSLANTRQINPTLTRRVNNRITQMARPLDALQARVCRRPRQASTRARRAETKDKLGRLIGTTLALPLPRPAPPLRRTHILLHP